MLRICDTKFVILKVYYTLDVVIVMPNTLLKYIQMFTI